MKYLVDGSEYVLNYRDLREQYDEFVKMDDATFMRNIDRALHFACFVSYLKELGLEATLSDKGIVHELVHLIAIPGEPLVNLEDIRKQFNTLLKLC